jgi:short-subunit dehydrogenase
MTTLAGARVWVVGASSGIGTALAHELTVRGASVAVSARRAGELEKVAGSSMLPVVADVTDRAGVVAAWADVRDRLGGTETVVFNAGYWEQMNARQWDADVFARHVEVNLLGLSNLLAAVLPDLVATGGRIVTVASVAGYRGLAGAEGYGATKAAQINLTEALRAALHGTDVDVVTVCPGFVRTPMTAGNRFPMPFMVEADDAARAVCDGLERGRPEIVFPLPMAVLMKTARLLPVRTWAALSGRFARRVDR